MENKTWFTVEASIIGKGHVQSGMPCQDENSITDLGNGWGLAIICDGAGSAKNRKKRKAKK